ncbi:unnamed protein product [Periconia digitata]|uniref:Uncharacterized protein n=1 Tax=Periconia digitata TaxID=1303443 RepID=A0A9W4XRT3_9PLEO|nr:unnamed protein product [Periconia digitata]
MPFLKYALPILAAATFASADCPTSDTVNIKSTSDVSFSDCSSYKGKITLDKDFSGDLSFGNDLEEIDGDLLIEDNANIKRVDGPAIKKISGTFSIKRTPELAALSFPLLDEAKKLEMEGLPNLRNLNFDSEISSVDELSIENTQLQDLKGINLNKTNSIRIIANGAIANISMGIKNMTGAIEIKDNNADVTISFPNLEHAGNMSYRAVGNLSLPSLKEVSPGSFGIQNSKMGSFYASNFTDVKDALIIANNTELADLHVPALQKVGTSYRIESNDKLSEINMPALEDVGAALDISGKNLTSVKTEKLDHVKGVFNLQSEASLGDSCKFYDDLNKKGDLGPKKQYTCKGDLNKASNAGAGTASGSNGSDPSDSAAVPVQVQTYLGLAGLFAVMFI